MAYRRVPGTYGRCTCLHFPPQTRDSSPKQHYRVWLWRRSDTYGKHINRARIVVLDPPDWSSKPIVLADFAARDRLPEDCHYQLDLAVHAVDNVDNTNTMHQAIQEWCLDAEREPWRLEASEQHSNSKPPDEPRIVAVPKLDKTSSRGSVECQSNGLVCVKLRNDEAASVEATSCWRVFHLASAAFDNSQLGHLLLKSLTSFLPLGTSIDLLIHPSEPHIDACLAVFQKSRFSEEKITHASTFAVIDKHDLVRNSGILFVQVEPIEHLGISVDFDTGKPMEDAPSLYQQWNIEHGMTVWRTFDIKRAALELANSRLDATVRGVY